MPAKKKARKSNHKGDVKESAGLPNGPESLDQVRELLFGAQIREAETRHSDLEQEFQNRLDRLHTAHRRDLEKAIEAMRATLDKFRAELVEERKQRREQDKSLSQQLSKAVKALDQLSQHVASENTALRDEIQRAATALRATTDDLAQATVERGTLAELLSDVADQIRPK